jgi:AraC family transcriptional regulator
MPRNHYLHRLLRDIARNPAGDHSLGNLAVRAGRSPFHLHRAFRELVRETPKQYTVRLRLERAAATLATGGRTVLDVALAAGFDSHEVFARAFRRRFGCSPSHYRRIALRAASAAERARHAELVGAAGPCVGLYRVPVDRWLDPARGRPDSSSKRRSTTMPTSPIERRMLAAQPILFVRRQASRAELPTMIGQCLGAIFAHAQKAGYALAGQPLSRYPSAGPGLVTVEIAMPLAAAGQGDGEIEAGFLADGPAIVATHEGPYDQLGETYAALERWMTTEGVTARDAPWEVYVTDPAEFPNPADWRTEVFWPIRDAG